MRLAEKEVAEDKKVMIPALPHGLRSAPNTRQLL
jgi:hypothetical protein